MPEVPVPRRLAAIAAAGSAVLALLTGCASSDAPVVASQSSPVPLVGSASTTLPAPTTPATTSPAATSPAGTSAVATTAAPAPPDSTASAAAAPASAAATPIAQGAAGTRCLMRLHGLTGDGQSTRTSGGITTLYPRGNVKWTDGNGYGWVYYDDDRFPGATYDGALAKVTASLEGVDCGQIIVYGFSNGGAMAAKMYCRGETLGGRVIGYVVDDPVTDAGVDGCAPAAGVKVAVFHSQFMDKQTKGNTQCRPGNSWICENNIRYLLSDYGKKIGSAGQIVAKDHDAGPYEPVVAGWWV